MPKPYQIIIADDDIDDQTIIKRAIMECAPDSEIISVFDGIELFEYLENKTDDQLSKIDVILLDINMPLMDGLTVLKEIKADKRYMNIPIFVISTLRIIDRVELYFQLGAAKVYSKPNKNSNYKQIVQEILE